jgi:hypothetical protein
MSSGTDGEADGADADGDRGRPPLFEEIVPIRDARGRLSVFATTWNMGNSVRVSPALWLCHSCVCVYVCVYMCVFVCLCVYLSACVCVCVCVCICVYVCV